MRNVHNRQRQDDSNRKWMKDSIKDDTNRSLMNDSTRLCQEICNIVNINMKYNKMS